MKTRNVKQKRARRKPAAEFGTVKKTISLKREVLEMAVAAAERANRNFSNQIASLIIADSEQLNRKAVAA